MLSSPDFLRLLAITRQNLNITIDKPITEKSTHTYSDTDTLMVANNSEMKRMRGAKSAMRISWTRLSSTKSDLDEQCHIL